MFHASSKGEQGRGEARPTGQPFRLGLIRLATRSSSSFLRNGLVRKSSALHASAALFAAMWAENRITGMCPVCSRPFNCLHSFRTASPCNKTSSRIRSGTSLSMCCRHAPFRPVWTRYPSPVSMVWTTSKIAGSSSTTRIYFSITCSFWNNKPPRLSGRAKEKVDPCPWTLSTHILPAW